ncbi:hypothetical protein P5V15_014449 [Pogonomyrmex californicus]
MIFPYAQFTRCVKEERNRSSSNGTPARAPREKKTREIQAQETRPTRRKDRPDRPDPVGYYFSRADLSISRDSLHDIRSLAQFPRADINLSKKSRERPRTAARESGWQIRESLANRFVTSYTCRGDRPISALCSLRKQVRGLRPGSLARCRFVTYARKSREERRKLGWMALRNRNV